MQQRIDRLEGLVLSLMTNGAGTAGPAAAVAAISRSASESGPTTGTGQEVEYDDEMIKEEGQDGEDSEVDAVSNSFGVLKVDNEAEKSLYIGDNDWHMVLADVRPFPPKANMGDFANYSMGRLRRSGITLRTTSAR